MKEGNAGHTFNLVGFGSREGEEEKYKKEKKKSVLQLGTFLFPINPQGLLPNLWTAPDTALASPLNAGLGGLRLRNLALHGRGFKTLNLREHLHFPLPEACGNQLIREGN